MATISALILLGEQRRRTERTLTLAGEELARASGDPQPSIALSACICVLSQKRRVWRAAFRYTYTPVTGRRRETSAETGRTAVSAFASGISSAGFLEQRRLAWCCLRYGRAAPGARRAAAAAAVAAGGRAAAPGSRAGRARPLAARRRGTLCCACPASNTTIPCGAAELYCVAPGSTTTRVVGRRTRFSCSVAFCCCCDAVCISAATLRCVALLCWSGCGPVREEGGVAGDALPGGWRCLPPGDGRGRWWQTALFGCRRLGARGAGDARRSGAKADAACISSPLCRSLPLRSHALACRHRSPPLHDLKLLPSAFASLHAACLPCCVPSCPALKHPVALGTA